MILNKMEKMQEDILKVDDLVVRNSKGVNDDMVIQKSNRYIDVVAVFLLVILELLFFRNVIFSDGLIGNRMDGRYTNLIAEHWYEFFSGKVSLGYLPEFYPLTYWGFTSSDLLMLNGVIHSFFRFLGFGIYDAYKFAIIIIHFFGTICMYYFLNKKIAIKPVWALIGTCIFSFSNNYAVKIYHTQLVVFSLIPFMLILVVGFVKNYSIRYKRNIYAFSLITMMAIGAYTGWYMIYFFVLFCMLSLILYSFSLKYRVKITWKTQFNIVKKMGVDILYYVLFGIVILLPFLCIYLPALGQSNGGWGWKVTTYYIPSIKDLINFGSGHMIFGNLFQFDPMDTTEFLGGISPIVLICILISMVYFIITSKTKDNKGIFELFFSIFIIAVVLLLCTVKIDNSYISLWYLFYKFCPVASSIRAVGRMWLFLLLPFSICISYVLDQSFRETSYSKSMVIGFVLLILVILFDFRVDGVYSNWSSDKENNYMARIGESIPDDAYLFFIINTDELVDDFAIPDEYQADALAIAQQFDMCTINGLTGVYPEKYTGLLWYVSYDDYIYGVAEWIYDHKIAERGFDYIYQYDVYTNTWTKFVFE